jgi:hypothetical protein
MYPGWTFDTIDDMSFEQIDSALRRGKPTKGIPIHSAEEARDIAVNWRKYLGI